MSLRNAATVLIILIWLGAAIFSGFSGPQLKLSESERVEIQKLAETICVNAKATPCPMIWSNRTHWMATLPASNAQALASVADLEKVFPGPDWEKVSKESGVSFHRGRMVVSYSHGNGAISIYAKQN